jgi:hypothetical protein
MEQRYRHVLAGALLAWLALPVHAEVVLTTETMTGTGLPPGQTLPASPQAEAAKPAPFTPKTVTTEKMLAWGPASATTTTPDTTKPAIRRFDRLRPRTREVQTIEKPVRKLP